MAVYVSMLVVGLLGCGASGPPASQPTEPSVVFEPTAPTEPQMLVGFFSSGSITYPEAIGALAIGMSERDARAELLRLRDPRLKVPDDVEIGTYRVTGGTLRAWDVVGISLIFDAQTGILDQIDLSMPGGQALSALVDAYGDHTGTKSDAAGRNVRIWTDTETQLQIELSEAEDGRSICKYRKLME